MLVRISAHMVQGIAIGQLCGSQCLELCWGRLQFELGGDELFHERRIAWFMHFVNWYWGVRIFSVCGQPSFLPMHECRGLQNGGLLNVVPRPERFSTSKRGSLLLT